MKRFRTNTMPDLKIVRGLEKIEMDRHVNNTNVYKISWVLTVDNAVTTLQFKYLKV